MISQDCADDTIALLRDAISQMAEEQREVCTGARGDDHWIVVTNLLSLSRDSSTLAAAMGVLARRSEEARARENPYPRGL